MSEANRFIADTNEFNAAHAKKWMELADATLQGRTVSCTTPSLSLPNGETHTFKTREEIVAFLHQWKNVVTVMDLVVDKKVAIRWFPFVYVPGRDLFFLLKASLNKDGYPFKEACDKEIPKDKDKDYPEGIYQSIQVQIEY